MLRFTILISCVLLAPASSAQITGQWFLTITHGGERLGILTVEENQGNLAGFIDGGPIDLTLDGNVIEMVVDYRDGGGRLLSRHLTGSVANDMMNGTLVAAHDGSTGTWRAEPWHGTSSSAPLPWST